MYGIDLNKTITYKHASLRFFEKNEHHVSRFCRDNVLLLVFEGVLRFTENSKPYEISSGCYHIQRSNSLQGAVRASDSPKYLYVHFDAEWAEGEKVLAADGRFDYERLREDIERLDRMAHQDYSLLERSALFFELLSALYKNSHTRSSAGKIADFIAKNYKRTLSLENIAEHFHFSKNYIINIFKREYGITPFEYVTRLRIREAERLLEATSASVEDIAFECGFNTYSNFYRQFCSHNSISPMLWRAEKRKDPSYR